VYGKTASISETHDHHLSNPRHSACALPGAMVLYWWNYGIGVFGIAKPFLYVERQLWFVFVPMISLSLYQVVMGHL
jgi:hypothetical protein